MHRALARPAHVVVVAASLLASGVASAAPDNLFGGRVVEERQAWVSLGYPDLEAGVRFPFANGRLDVGPTFRFSYGVAAFAAVPNSIAFQPGVTARLLVLDTGPLTGAVVGNVWVAAGIGTLPTAFGVGLVEPGLLLTYRVGRRVDLTFGLQLQLALWVQGDGVYVLGAMPLVLAVEFPVSRDIGLGFRFEGGPAFGGGAAPAEAQGVSALALGGVGARVRAVVGASFKF